MAGDAAVAGRSVGGDVADLSEKTGGVMKRPPAMCRREPEISSGMRYSPTWMVGRKMAQF